MPLPTTHGTFRVMAEPRFNFTPQGKAVFSAFVSAGSKRKGTDTYDNFVATAVVFGDNAEALANTVQQGQYVALSGEVRDNEFTTKDGDSRQSREINCTFGYIAVLPPRDGGGQQGQNAAQNAQQFQGQAADPFGNAGAVQQAPQAQQGQFQGQAQQYNQQAPAQNGQFPQQGQQMPQQFPQQNTDPFQQS